MPFYGLTSNISPVRGLRQNPADIDIASRRFFARVTGNDGETWNTPVSRCSADEHHFHRGWVDGT